jgi:L-threonylcarbamoyladenylate synthase
MTRIVRIESVSDIQKAVKLAAEIMSHGGIILYPTDTTYALGVNALDVQAVDKVFQLKGRDYSKPVHVVVGNIQQASEYATVSEMARKVGDHFLPGALTLVLPQKAETAIPPLLVAGESTLGVRIPDQPICTALAEAVNFPFTTTSANRSGMPNTYDVDTIKAQLGADFERIDLVLDAGALNGGVSTVIAIEDEAIRLIRQGAIPFSDIVEIAEATQRKV